MNGFERVRMLAVSEALQLPSSEYAREYIQNWLSGESIGHRECRFRHPEGRTWTIGQP